MVELRISGANQLADLARDLKSEADGKEIRKDMLKGLRTVGNKAATVLGPKAAREGLPKRGGINEYVASSKFTTRTRTAGKNVGVRIVGAKNPKHDINAMDRGQLRHRVFDKDVWVLQTITPGWWTQGVSDDDVLDPLRKELIQVVEDIARRVARG